MNTLTTFFKRYTLFAYTILVGIAALILLAAHQNIISRWIIGIFCFIVTIKMLYEMIQDIMHGKWGVDILAVAAVIATNAVGEQWAALVIILMMTGGEALENYASKRAQAELSALMDRAPKTAHKKTSDGMTDIKIEAVQVGDTLVVLPGEVIPVDAAIVAGNTTVDESSLTGESEPIEKGIGDNVDSGTVNGSAPIDITATQTAGDSQYAQIIQLVKAAGDTRAPFVRLADRYAVPFTIISFIIAGIAWYTSGLPIRFAEVLVVATPCPLLLAAPIAMISGMSRSAKHGIIVKSGSVLEQLSRIKSVAFDKTGTLTENQLRISEVWTTDGVSKDDVLAMAASIGQLSTHITSSTINALVADKKLALLDASDHTETPGKGMSATVNGKHVIGGRRSFLVDSGIDEATLPHTAHTAMLVAVDGNYYGAIIFADTVRKNSAATIAELKKLGVQNIAMVTGDNKNTAQQIASALGITNVHAECLPKNKVEVVRDLTPKLTMMVGDGINDAPVLAASDVGIAMGARGATAASESADVVIMVDDISKAAQAIKISQRTIHIALESIIAGIVISIGLMIIASTGKIPAIVGAALQEVVDVVVILNALRAHIDQ